MDFTSFTPLIEWLIACIIFVVGVYVIDVISGHRREGKIYDFMKLMLASDLANNKKKTEAK